jgi:hypothetical protein
MSAPTAEGLGATEPQANGPEPVKFTGEQDEKNLNDEESFYLLHSLGNMGNESNKIYMTKDSNHNVQEPLQAKPVGTNIINQDNLVKDEYFSNKMIDIQ